MAMARACAWVLALVAAAVQGSAGDCVSHSECSLDTYCDVFNDCFRCSGCVPFNDPIDGRCPDRCVSRSCIAQSSCDSDTFCSSDSGRCELCGLCSDDVAVGGLCPSGCTASASGSDGLQPWEISLIVMGTVMGLVILCCLVCVCCSMNSKPAPVHGRATNVAQFAAHPATSASSLPSYTAVVQEAGPTLAVPPAMAPGPTAPVVSAFSPGGGSDGGGPIHHTGGHHLFAWQGHAHNGPPPPYESVISSRH